METITGIRASSVDESMDCERRHAGKTFSNEVKEAGYEMRKTNNSIGSLVGRAVHAAVAKLLHAKQKQTVLPPETAVELVLPDFYTDMSEGVELDKTTPNTQVAIRQVYRATAYYAQTRLPHIEPLIVEAHYEAVLDEQFKITGSPDLLTTPESGAVLRDLKNEKAQNFSHLGQGGTYSLILRSHGFQVDRILIDRIKRQSDKAMREGVPMISTIEYPVEIAESYAMNAIMRIRANVLEFRRRQADPDAGPAHEAFMANPTSMMCSPIYCRAYGTSWCPEGAVAKPLKEALETAEE